MSIMQDYENYRNEVGEKEWEKIQTFLDLYPEYYLSDLLYDVKVYKQYTKWKNTAE